MRAWDGLLVEFEDASGCRGRQLAQLLGVKDAQLSRMKRDPDLVHYKHLQILAGAMDISLTALLMIALLTDAELSRLDQSDLNGAALHNLASAYGYDPERLNESPGFRKDVLERVLSDSGFDISKAIERSSRTA